MLVSRIIEYLVTRVRVLPNRVRRFLAKKDAKAYVAYLRTIGVKIGKGTVITTPGQFDIDLSRPFMITIGDNCRLNTHMTLMCHDAAAKVFRQTKGELLPSNGHITIGNNVYFGRYTTVLKGVTIGDNCIIGFGATVMKDIPSNSVAVGTPAKVICTLDQYYERRKAKALEEAFEYARAIKERKHRRPVPADFFESFGYFVNGNEVDKYPEIPIRYQLGPGFEEWQKNHKAIYSSFDDFLHAAGID